MTLKFYMFHSHVHISTSARTSNQDVKIIKRKENSPVVSNIHFQKQYKNHRNKQVRRFHNRSKRTRSIAEH